MNPFYSIYSKTKPQESFNKNQGIVRTLLGINKECPFFIILSSSNCSRIGPFISRGVKYHKESIKKDPLSPIRNSLGPLGTALQIANFFSFYHLITHNQILVTNYLQLDNLKQTLQLLKFEYYLMDENGRIYNPDPCSNIILNPFKLDLYFLHYNFCEETSTKIYLGQFVCEMYVYQKRTALKIGSVLIVQSD